MDNALRLFILPGDDGDVAEGVAGTAGLDPSYRCWSWVSLRSIDCQIRRCRMVVSRAVADLVHAPILNISLAVVAMMTYGDGWGSCRCRDQFRVRTVNWRIWMANPKQIRFENMFPFVVNTRNAKKKGGGQKRIPYRLLHSIACGCKWGGGGGGGVLIILAL